MNRIDVVVGGQFGSEGKGAVTAYLARGRADLCAVRVAGPNAGHSVVDDRGRKWALRQVPVAAVSNTQSRLVIAAGSEIDPPVLEQEVIDLDSAGFGVRKRLFIDGEATIVTDVHKAREAAGRISVPTVDGPIDETVPGAMEDGLVHRIGSTGKGIGAARADRIMRDARVWAQIDPDSAETDVMLRNWLQQRGDVLIEGTQGYGLGLHAGYYPKCTSSDCRAIDFMSMAGIAPVGVEIQVWVVLRTFPIRVAGNSGPMEQEIDWERLGKETLGYVKPEYTTVTQKMRRVGRWDRELAREAVQANGGEHVQVALTFFDYWYPELVGAVLPGALEEKHRKTLDAVEAQIGTKIRLLGTGPASIIDLKG